MSLAIHLKLNKEKISTWNVILQNPGRITWIAEQLDNPKTLAHYREFSSILGKYKGKHTSCITGIGGPSIHYGRRTSHAGS